MDALSRSNLVSTSFMTDISNFEDFDSSHSLITDNDPLTSTPKKSDNQQQGMNPSEALPVSPLSPPFQLVDEPSVESSSTQSEQSSLEVDDGDANRHSPTNSRQGQWVIDTQCTL